MNSKQTWRILITGCLFTLACVPGCASNKGDNHAASGTNANMVVVNSRCAMQPNSPVNPDAPTAQWNGKKVGFCCAGCLNAWNKLDDAQKAERLSKAM